ncbi:MAG: hypothetical protein WHS46_10225 [Desulfosoma sp.]
MVKEHDRRSIRLKGHDYAQPGAYFVTLCTHNRECLFGEVVKGEMRLNDLGQIVREEWFRSAEIRREMKLNPAEFVVMPNHIHGIVWIHDMVGATSLVGATGRSPLPCGAPLRCGSSLAPKGPAPRSLASFMAGFKSVVAKRINHLRATPGIPVW